MYSGYVINNTGKARHIFKRTVYPGGRVPLEPIFALLQQQVPRGQVFLDWLAAYLPQGWEIVLEEDLPSVVLTATPEVHSSGPGMLAEFSGMEDNDGAHELATESSAPPAMDVDPEQLTAREIYSLQVKDNPKKVIGQITSVHKLRRALAMCKKDTRKKLLMGILRARIKELVDQGDD